MKVVDFIKRLNEIGFDEKTELTFSCVSGETGNWHELKPDYDEQDPFSYGESLTGMPYTKDTIDFCLDVDGCKDYIEEVKYNDLGELTEELLRVIGKYESKHAI